MIIDTICVMMMCIDTIFVCLLCYNTILLYSLLMIIFSQQFLAKNPQVLRTARPGFDSFTITQPSLSKADLLAAQERKRRIEATIARKIGFSPDAPSTSGFVRQSVPIKEMVPVMPRAVGESELIVLDSDASSSAKVMVREASEILVY